MEQQLRRRAAWGWRLGAGLAVGALVLATFVTSSTASPAPRAVGKTQAFNVKRGGTAYWAMAPATTPDWIFPFEAIQYFSVANIDQFQYLMYRPLYWFGSPTSASPNVDFSLSLAKAPVWSNGNKTVTIHLKGWRFADGQKVDAQSLVFWLNMMKAEAGNWAGTVPGPATFPGNIKSYSAPGGAGGNTVVINLDQAFSTYWYLYNELSQLIPMAEAWDVTSLTGAPGSGGCGAVSHGEMTGAATLKACTAVWTFDTDNNGTAKSPQMSGDLATYTTNKLWDEGVDGPWKLSGFVASTGQSTFVPNPSYSGPQKPILSKFVEVPYTSDSSAFNALAAGGATAPQVGYLFPQNTPQKPAGLGPTTAGPNAPQLNANYTLNEWSSWSINYFPENYDSTLGAGGHAGMVFRQLYFRQALQDMVNQPGIILTYLKGYGIPTYGPAPVYPKNSFAHGVELKPGGPYPFDPGKGISTLKSHGWHVVTNGTSRCVKPGTGAHECGAGIPKGTPLTFQEVYLSGANYLTQEVDYEVSEWAKAGIQVSLKAEPFDSVLKTALPCVPKSTPACHSWDMANWGGGWSYDPDFMPTGGEIFATGAGSNSGDYNSATNNRLIVETHKSSSLSAFYQYENYLAEQLPVIWQPVVNAGATGEAEISHNIGGVLPINALQNLTPEYWYFK